MSEAVAIELARLVREALARVAARKAREQLGEAFH